MFRIRYNEISQRSVGQWRSVGFKLGFAGGVLIGTSEVAAYALGFAGIASIAPWAVGPIIIGSIISGLFLGHVGGHISAAGNAATRKAWFNFNLASYRNIFANIKLILEDQASKPSDVTWYKDFLIEFSQDIIDIYTGTKAKEIFRRETSQVSGNFLGAIKQAREEKNFIKLCEIINKYLKEDPEKLGKTSMFSCFESLMSQPFSNPPETRLEDFFKKVLSRLKENQGFSQNQEDFKIAVFDLIKDIQENAVMREIMHKRFPRAYCEQLYGTLDNVNPLTLEASVETVQRCVCKVREEKLDNDIPEYYVHSYLRYEAMHQKEILNNQISEFIIQALNKNFGYNRKNMVCIFMEDLFSEWLDTYKALSAKEQLSESQDIFYFSNETRRRYKALKSQLFSFKIFISTKSRNLSTLLDKHIPANDQLAREDERHACAAQSILLAYKEYFSTKPDLDSYMCRVIMATVENITYITKLAEKIYYLKDIAFKGLVIDVMDRYSPKSNWSKAVKDFFKVQNYDVLQGRHIFYSYLTYLVFPDIYPYNYGKNLFHILLSTLTRYTCDANNHNLSDTPVVPPRGGLRIGNHGHALDLIHINHYAEMANHAATAALRFVLPVKPGCNKH